jgi:hypothetical protein
MQVRTLRGCADSRRLGGVIKLKFTRGMDGWDGMGWIRVLEKMESKQMKSKTHTYYIKLILGSCHLSVGLYIAIFLTGADRCP